MTDLARPRRRILWVESPTWKTASPSASSKAPSQKNTRGCRHLDADGSGNSAGAFAELEREIIRERVKAELDDTSPERRPLAGDRFP